LRDGNVSNVSSRSRGEDVTGPASNIEHNPERDPDDWLSGDEPSTGPQESYLHTLAQEAGEEVPTNLSKADACKEIDRLQRITGRGQS
jgi:hypothetical protein